MKSKNSMRTLVITLSIVALVGISTAYAALTGTLNIAGTNQTVTNPDVYFANGYDSLASFASSSVSSGSSAGTATISDAATAHYASDPGTGEPSTYQTGKTVTITGDTFDCTAAAASLTWTLPVKNYGTSTATLGTASTTLKVTINSIEYNFTGSFSSGSATLTNATVSGLSFDISAPTTLDKRDGTTPSGNIVITPRVAQAGVTVSGVQYGTFSYTIDVPYNQGT